MTAFVGMTVEQVLHKAVTATEANHRFIANNIANVDTPGYNPVTLDFQKTLREELYGRGGLSLRRSRPRHMTFASRRLQFEDQVSLSKNDFNKVNLDEEIVKLSENTSRNATYSLLLGRRFEETLNMLRTLGR